MRGGYRSTGGCVCAAHQLQNIFRRCVNGDVALDGWEGRGIASCSTSRRLSYRKHGSGIVITRRNGSRDVITHHISLRSEWCPRYHHWPSQLLFRAPTGSAIGGGDEANIEFAGGRCAAKAIGIVVEG